MGWWKKKEKKKRALLCRERGAMLLEDVIKCCDGKSNPIKFFSANQMLGRYLGKTDDDRMIIIKKYSYFDSEFCRDVAISSMVSGHKNFMKLAGCCLEFDKYPVMVYYGEKKIYSSIDLEKIVLWKRRMKIAEDIATALAYLHSAFSSPFVYRIMSIQNILIDEDGVAKLTDFSSCISIPQGEKFVEVDEIVGTLGYIVSEKCIVSEKTDTYAFGMFMVLLLMGGRERFDKFRKRICGDDYDPKYMWKTIVEGGIVNEIIDPKMLEKMGEVTEEERSQLNAFLSLSLRCSGFKGEVPTMTEVAKELKKIQRSSQNVAVALRSSSPYLRYLRWIG